MTNRLYYTDALCTVFDARVVAHEIVDGCAHVTLDTTAFYPTSGGQPFDTGRLGNFRVIDVIDRDDGTIAHVLDAPSGPNRGDGVRGEIDWPRRLDHMQQHTGQHVLSAAFDRACGARTESFHLGVSSSTIDLAREVSPAEITAAEEAACAVVWEDRPVTVRFATEAEAAALPLRKESARTGRLRLVEVEAFDLSACGGTHVPRTGMIGVIAVSGWERFKGGSRIEFVCGRRALLAHRRLRDVVTPLGRQLSIAPEDLSATIERWQEDARGHVRLIRRLQEEQAGLLAVGLRRDAEVAGGLRRVIVTQAGWDPAALKTLAAAVVTEPGFVAVVTGDGTPVPVVAARSADVAFDAGQWMKQVTTALGGRGGGRPELAQGGVAGEVAAVVAFARDTVR